MSSNFNSYFEQNRAAFDHLDAKPETKNSVLASVRPKEFPSVIVWKIAAAVFFAATVYLIIRPSVEIKPNKQLIVSDFNEIEKFYYSELATRQEWLQASGVSHSSGQELEQLQSMYEVLHEQWLQSPTSRIEDAMTLNLIVRLKRMDELISVKAPQLRGS